MATTPTEWYTNLRNASPSISWEKLGPGAGGGGGMSSPIFDLLRQREDIRNAIAKAELAKIREEIQFMRGNRKERPRSKTLNEQAMESAAVKEASARARAAQEEAEQMGIQTQARRGQLGSAMSHQSPDTWGKMARAQAYGMLSGLSGGAGMAPSEPHRTEGSIAETTRARRAMDLFGGSPYRMLTGRGADTDDDTDFSRYGFGRGTMVPSVRKPGDRPQVPQYKEGTLPGTVPKTEDALVHKGEIIVDAEQADKPLLSYLVMDRIRKIAKGQVKPKRGKKGEFQTGTLDPLVEAVLRYKSPPPREERTPINPYAPAPMTGIDLPGPTELAMGGIGLLKRLEEMTGLPITSESPASYLEPDWMERGRTHPGGPIGAAGAALLGPTLDTAGDVLGSFLGGGFAEPGQKEGADVEPDKEPMVAPEERYQKSLQDARSAAQAWREGGGGGPTPTFTLEGQGRAPLELGPGQFDVTDPEWQRGQTEKVEQIGRAEKARKHRSAAEKIYDWVSDNMGSLDKDQERAYLEKAKRYDAIADRLEEIEERGKEREEGKAESEKEFQRNLKLREQEIKLTGANSMRRETWAWYRSMFANAMKQAVMAKGDAKNQALKTAASIMISMDKARGGNMDMKEALQRVRGAYQSGLYDPNIIGTEMMASGFSPGENILD